ncbi:MAG: hypothetical protein ACREX6_07110, partial [Casimicrobiaceae bacterium]
REMELDELRKLQGEMQGAARELERTVTAAASEVSAGVHHVEHELNQAAAEAGGGMTEASAGSGAPVPPPGATAHADPRQVALPGFEKI